MEEILKEISNYKLKDSDTDKFESILNKLKEYYGKNERHKYSEVSRFIFSLDDSQLDVIAVNLKLIIKQAGNEHELVRNLEKLIDHTDLALFQRNYIESQVKKNELLLKGIYERTILTRDNLNKSREEFLEAKKSIEEKYKKISSDLEQHKSSVYTQFVTILGIFTAIAFGVFGGMEILENVMSNIAHVKVSKLLMFSSLVIGAVLTILNMLLTGISNLVESPIRSCGCKRSDPCNHSPFQRHPIYFTGMIACLYLFLIGTIAHGFETKNFKGVSLIDKFMNNGFNVIIIAIILLVIIIFVAYLINKLMNKRNNKE